MEDQIFVQHRFTVEVQGILYSDALIVPLDEYEALAPTTIQELKQERVDDFIYFIENPPPVIDIPIEEQLAELADQIEALVQQQEELQALLQDDSLVVTNA